MKVQNCKGPGIKVEKQPKEAAGYADPSSYMDQCLFGHISCSWLVVTTDSATYIHQWMYKKCKEQKTECVGKFSCLTLLAVLLLMQPRIPIDPKARC